MDSISLSRFIGYVAASLGTLLLLATIVITSWMCARPAAGQPSSRLRWHMITKNRIAKGTQIKADDVTWTLGRVSEEAPLIPMSKTVVGKYATDDITPDITCVPDLLSDLAPAKPPSGGVVIPIEVKTSDVSSLKPEMRLAFAQDNKEIQPKTTLLNKQNHQGLLLLSMTASTKDPANTTLFVAIEKSDLESVPLLVSGTWRPIILGAVELTSQEQQPVQTNARRRPVRRRASQ